MRIRRKLLELPPFYCGTRACTHLSLNNMLAPSNWRRFIPRWKESKHLYGGGGRQLFGISCSIVAAPVFKQETSRVTFGGFLDTEEEKVGFIRIGRIFLYAASFSQQCGAALEVDVDVIKETIRLDHVLGLLFKMIQSLCNAQEKALQAERGWSQS